MKNKLDEFLLEMWAQSVPLLARNRHLQALTPSDATREFSALDEIPIEEEEIESIVEQIVSDELVAWDSPEPELTWLEMIRTSMDSAVLTEGLADEEEHIDDEAERNENHEHLGDGNDSSDISGGSE